MRHLSGICPGVVNLGPDVELFPVFLEATKIIFKVVLQVAKSNIQIQYNFHQNSTQFVTDIDREKFSASFGNTKTKAKTKTTTTKNQNVQINKQDS